MCGTRGEGVKEEDVSAISTGTSDMPPAPPTESGVTESSSTDLVGDGDGISPVKARQTPRMGLGATSNKTSSANSLSKFKGEITLYDVIQIFTTLRHRKTFLKIAERVLKREIGVFKTF